ncbi:hypothetical protein PV326_007287 [Microctonus aethiopoides]|nr:hypothetical protein PV326_007287 [Microctonus aethiopoides]
MKGETKLDVQEKKLVKQNQNRPSFWGLINPQWSLCSKGRRQSPINIEPDKLLFDPHLRPVQVDKHKVAGHLHNTGQFLVFKADKEAKIRVNITGGPLAYHYQFEEIYIHYGLSNEHGSEHQVNKYAFPAEQVPGDEAPGSGHQPILNW